MLAAGRCQRAAAVPGGEWAMEQGMVRRAAISAESARCALDWSAEDVAMMELALQEARAAAAEGEVPVGAVVVEGGKVLARAHNRREATVDPTAHAELLAVRQAAGQRGSWRLDGTTLYSTLEPCPMCAGALWLARVDTLVFAAHDPKAGAAGSLYNVVADPRLNHRLRVRAGLMAEESRRLLRAFFDALREQADAAR